MAKSKKSKRFYQHGPPNDKRRGYRREYNGNKLRRKGFTTKADAERHLTRAMQDLDALERGEVRVEPTTLGEAFEMHKRRFELRANTKTAPRYRVNGLSHLRKVEGFVENFGKDRHLITLSADDLMEWYQVLVGSMTQASALTYISCLSGVLKTAKSKKADLANWTVPKLEIERHKGLFESRTMTPIEYATLVDALYAAANRLKYARDAADAVRLCRNTGGRLNEVLRMKLSQIHFDKKHIVLMSTKRDAERKIPMSSTTAAMIRQRIKDRKAADGLVFAYSVSRDFDVVVREYVEIVAREIGLNYGRATGGFTMHSLRHTFITDLLSKGVDIATCVRLSGHRTLDSFSVYLHETEFGKLKAAQTIEGVDGILTGSGSLGTLGALSPYR